MTWASRGQTIGSFLKIGKRLMCSGYASNGVVSIWPEITVIFPHQRKTPHQTSSPSPLAVHFYIVVASGRFAAGQTFLKKQSNGHILPLLPLQLLGGPKQRAWLLCWRRTGTVGCAQCWIDANINHISLNSRNLNWMKTKRATKKRVGCIGKTVSTHTHTHTLMRFLFESGKTLAVFTIFNFFQLCEV